MVGRVDRPQHPVGHVRGAGDLQEVTAGAIHQTFHTVASGQHVVVMGELAAALEREFAGEVRDDAWSRHLYAADASMYAIEPWASRFRAMRTTSRRRWVAGGSGCRSSRAAPGRASPGRRRAARAGARLLAAHERIVGLDAAHAACASQPGLVQEDLNRPRSAVRLGFGPDTSTSNRATLGGMIGNNSRVRVARYGTTIDHVVELEVVLSDGSRATSSASLAGQRSSADHAACKAILSTTRGRSPRTTQHWRQSGGYRLDRLDPFNLAKLVVGSEGTLAIVTEATVRLVGCRRRRCRGRPFRPLAGDRGDRGRARAASRRRSR